MFKKTWHITKITREADASYVVEFCGFCLNQALIVNFSYDFFHVFKEKHQTFHYIWYAFHMTKWNVNSVSGHLSSILCYICTKLYCCISFIRGHVLVKVWFVKWTEVLFNFSFITNIYLKSESQREINWLNKVLHGELWFEYKIRNEIK